MSTQLERITGLHEAEIKPYLGYEASDDELDALFGTHAETVRLYARTEAQARPQGDSLIVLLPGLMGSVLKDEIEGTVLWINPLAYLAGKLNRLDLAPDGQTDATPGVRVAAPNPLWLAYAKMLLRLEHDFAVCSFPYDWRLSLDELTQRLRAFIDAKLADGPHDQVTLVGHSLGGLVIIDYLTGEATRTHAEAKVRRAVTLGTPFRGAVNALSVLANRPNTQMVLAQKLNPVNDPVSMVRTFPSMYAILPAPSDLYPGWDPLSGLDIWNPQTWLDSGFAINADHLHAAEARHRRLAAADPQVELYCVVGTNYETAVSLSTSRLDADPLLVKAGEKGGDGTVEVASARFPGRPVYYLQEDHVELVLDRAVISAVMEWVEGGQPGELVQRIEDVVLDDGVLRATGPEAFGAPPVEVEAVAGKIETGEMLNHEEIKALYTVF